MNCPACSAVPCHTADGATVFKCGSIRFHDGSLGQSSQCGLREVHSLRTFKAAVIAADKLLPSETCRVIRELCKGER